MKNAFRKLRFRWKLFTAQFISTLTVLLVVELVRGGASGGAAMGVGFLTAALLALAASDLLSRRVTHIKTIVQGWFHGQLNQRIHDEWEDDISQIAQQIDRLAARLELDEKDLSTLRERNDRLTDQVRALAVVEERNRLARDLHDGVKQYLFSLAMTASAARDRMEGMKNHLLPADVTEMVKDMETNAKAAQHEMTRLIEDLRPISLQEQGFAEALNQHTLLFGAREHLLVYLDVQGDDRHVPLTIAESLYRVAQEALLNVARHARATRVDVCLRCLPEQVILSIHDNGVGFDTNRSARGLGLSSMHERMLHIGGRLTFTSQPAAGTTLLAEVGLSRPSAAVPAVAGVDRLLPQPSMDNWGWLGQRLVIPVGQNWPWHPADQVHLRGPLLAPEDGPVTIREKRGPLGLGCQTVIHTGTTTLPLHHSSSGLYWKQNHASWAIETIQAQTGRALLTRNSQPLAAMQYHGRMLDTWSEIIYDGHGYCLSHNPQQPAFILSDCSGSQTLTAIPSGQTWQVTLTRPAPLDLLIMVTARLTGI